MNLNKLKISSAIALSSLYIFINNAQATDIQSQNSYKEGINSFNKGSYRTAASDFKAAELYADSYVLKVNALKKIAESYQKADMLYQEYLAINKLITNYPSEINFNDYIEREDEIGNSFYNGYRETPWSWLPWIQNDNKCIEVYENILAQAPYAKFVPEMLIKLATSYLIDNKTQKAIDTYKLVINQYNNSETAYVAYLNLADIYVKLSKRGDGDGAYASSARETLNDYIKKYPNTPELPWAKNTLETVYETQASQLLYLANYYNNKGNTDIAKRYIKEILINYPETKAAVSAQNILDSMEMPIYPTINQAQTKDNDKQSKYKEVKLIDPPEKIWVTPENSSGKWLTPIKDLNIEEENNIKDEYINKL